MGAEVVGTFFVTLAATSVDVLYYTHASGVDYVSRWLARGFIATAAIYAFSEISGAHLDPAISLGFALRGGMPLKQMLLYWLGQFGGAFAAAFAVFAVWGAKVALGASHPGPGFNGFEAALVEVVLTFILMMVVLMTSREAAAVGKQSALAVGLTIAACGFFAGPVSGASMNPARSIAPQIVGSTGDLAWIYATGPCAGALLAALVATLFFRRPDAGERKAAKGA